MDRHTLACPHTLFFSLSAGVNEYLWGDWEYLRGCLNTFGKLGDRLYRDIKNVSKYFCAQLNISGALFNIYGEHFTFTGSVLCVVIIYGEVRIIFGDIKLAIKLLCTILNFCGILPQTDRHISLYQYISK